MVSIGRVSAAAERSELWAPLLDDPSTTGIFADFDGTLSQIVEDPDEAVPVAGLYPILERLGSRFGLVGVLTGRPVGFLDGLLPPAVSISGLHGLERSSGGRYSAHPLAGVWREVVTDVASLLRDRGPEGLRVEEKGISITLHYRGHPELEEEARSFADRQAARSGLVCHATRMGYELRPPIQSDCGTAILEQAGELKSVCYLGDDQTDTAAFDALDRLAAEGVHAVRVVVESPECPPGLCDRADVHLEGPVEVVELLRFLSEPAPISRAG